MFDVALYQGIVWAGFIGLAIGNFATNPIYRLPRNESLFLKDPYCGDCNARLTARDLFPVLSWLSTKGKCRYCGASVPGAYTVVEAITGIVFVLCYLKYQFSDSFILTSFGLTAFIMIASMLYIDNFFSNRTLVAALFFGALFRTLHDGTITDFSGSAYAALLVGALVWKLSKQPMVRDMASFPIYLKLLVVCGVWLNLTQLLFVLVATAPSLFFVKKSKWAAEYSLIAATLTMILSAT